MGERKEVDEWKDVDEWVGGTMCLRGWVEGCG